jgi:pre-mRNA-splicing factor ISY1
LNVIKGRLKEWEDAYKTLAEALGLDADGAVPPIPRPNPTPLSVSTSHSGTAAEKRKTTENDESDDPADADMADGTVTSSKRLKTDSDANGNGNQDDSRPPPIFQLPPLLSVLQPSDVSPPKMPTKQEMESVLLQLRKKAVLDEYLGD